MITDEIAVVDADSHLTEPADLWISRLGAKWAEVAPRVRFVPEQGEEYWFIGDHPTHPAWTHSRHRWPLPPPSHPRVFAEVDPTTYDPVARAGALDEFGIAVQVLYPNIVAFQLADILSVDDPAFGAACVRAYNDYVLEFCDEAPGRFVPIMALPFWDLEASLAEIDRGVEAGHRGIVFANRPEVLAGHPVVDPHWDPLWERAQAAGLSVNFHVGFGVGFETEPLRSGAVVGQAETPPLEALPPDRASRQLLDLGEEWVAQYRLALTRIGTPMMLSNSTAILDLIVTGVCERFPGLGLVSVESGWGYLPFVLESADWNWVSCGASRSLPSRLLPSEYFRRQCYTTFWFEHETVVRCVDLYPDNVMFETDFPHAVSLTPGAGIGVKSARDTIEANLSGLDPDLLRKILSDNARRVYHLDR